MRAMRERAPPERAAFLGDIFALVELAARDDQVGAALRERLRHAIAEPAPAAGAERDLTGAIAQRTGGQSSRKSVVSGQSGSIMVELGGRGNLKQKNQQKQ